MMSRHLFFKAMREDLRHKIWMIALSSLGSFLVLPVAWLLAVSDGYDFWPTEFPPYLVSSMFHNMLLAGGGFIAIAGAVIVGLFGFRFVFHKNMIDTYHSIPIKRRTLYSVCWLNGFLIWLVPFLICLLVTLSMATVYMVGTPSRKWIPAMWAEAGTNVLILVVVFLLVYHLVLTAVMVSGNVWNTLVSMMILGFGVVSIFGLGLGFFAYFIDTVYLAALNPEPAFYGSPLLSAVILIYMKAQADVFGASLFVIWKPLLINFCVMALLGVLSWWLYKKRASELAEHGIRNKVFSAVLKFLVGIAAGMGGWMLFYLMVSHAGWGMFGLVLVGVLAFGVMDIIFNMEFKAFFAHKLQMVVTIVCALVICFCFYLDAFGYDTYLPDKEDIAEIAIYDTDYSNMSFYSSYENEMMENLHFRDVDAAYAYLQRVTDREKGIEPGLINEDAGFAAKFDVYRSRRIATKVTLKNGRTYYRYYTIINNDLDVVWPMLSDEEYLEWNYVVHQKWAESYDTIRRYCFGKSGYLTDVSKDVIWAIAEAYNRDLLENPATVLLNQGKLLTSLELSRSNYQGDYRFRSQRLEIYESMKNTIAVLNELGLGDWVEQTDPSEISEIQLSVGSNNMGSIHSALELINVVRNYYEVYEGSGNAGTADEMLPGGQEYAQGYAELDTEVSDAGIPMYDCYLSITSEDEIRELMQLMNRQTPQHVYGPFYKGYVQVNVIVDGQGESVTYYIRKGDLPEKYILRFGELYEQVRQEQESGAL